MYQWTNDLIGRVLPRNWVSNPRVVSETSKCAIELLESRTIDAICAPYPLVVDLDQGKFSIIPLFSTKLLILASNQSDLSYSAGLTDTDVRDGTSYAPLDFVPAKASECSKEIDSQLFGVGDAESAASLKRFWGTALTLNVRPDLQVLDYSTRIFVGEFLVVSSEWTGHPCTLQLLECLAKNMAVYSRTTPDGHLIDLACEF